MQSSDAAISRRGHSERSGATRHSRNRIDGVVEDDLQRRKGEHRDHSESNEERQGHAMRRISEISPGRKPRNVGAAAPSRRVVGWRLRAGQDIQLTIFFAIRQGELAVSRRSHT